MTDERLDRLDALAGAATPGPWVAQSYDDGSSGNHPWYIDTHAYADGPEPVVAPTYPLGAADAAFIAACDPATIRELVAAVRERDELREAATELLRWRHAVTCHWERATGECNCGLTALRAALHREAGA